MPATPTEPAVLATEAAAPATATTQPTSTAEPAASETAATETGSAQAEATVVEATVAPSASATEAITSTATATPTTPAVPPPIGNVEQPPYAPSECSDRFPCNDDVASWEARIRVPEGFEVTYFAHIQGGPTSITFGPDGLLYVAVQATGTIYTVDATGNVSPYVGGFLVPTGLAFQPGTNKLYVSSRLRGDSLGGEAQISVVQAGSVSQLIDGLPCCYAGLHSANGIAFGPDGFGYVGVGARADHGEILEEGPDKGQQDELHPLEASILRFSPDGSVVEPYARGFRNPYDIAWDANGQLYATDNGPDGSPTFNPPDELHRVVPGGQHGYPWYECDVCFSPPPGAELIEPIYNFPSHSAVTGITAYLDDQFPGYYNNLFVTLWTALPFAERVVRFGPGGVNAITFATGFAAPIDVTVGPEGSLYVVDNATGIIFRITYTG